LTKNAQKSSAGRFFPDRFRRVFDVDQIVVILRRLPVSSEREELLDLIG
jgi:hypothetical protein